MNLNRLILSQKKTRFIFTIIASVISSVILVIGLFTAQSIKSLMEKNITLAKDEYHLSINDSLYDKKINYYQELSSKFNKVIPYNQLNINIDDQLTYIVSTVLEEEKILYNDGFYDIELNHFDNNIDEPAVYIYDVYYNELLNEIMINNQLFKIKGKFKIKDNNSQIISTNIYLMI